MSKFRFFIILFLISSLFSYAAYAYKGSLVVEPLPLDGVLRELVISNPQILEAVKVYEGVKDEVGIADSGYKPVISTQMSVGQEYTDGVASDFEKRNLTASSASITARQNLFNGSATSNYVSETKARVLAASYSALDVANNTFIATAEAYINVLRELELLELAAENVATQKQILRQIREKTEAGFGRTSDLLNTESRFALAQANVISQQQNLKRASIALHKHLGRFADPKQLVLPDAVFTFAESPSDLVDLAFANYPAVQVAKYNVAVKKYAMKKGEGAYYPSLDAELSAAYDNNSGGDEGENRRYSAMIYLNYDLYDGGRRSAEKKKNMKAVLKENERVYIERRNLNEAVRLAVNIRQAEHEKYTFLQNHVKLTDDTLKAYKEEYQLGRRTLIELLDMENEFQKAKEAMVESKYSALVAYFRVMHVTGALLYEYQTDLMKRVGLESNQIRLDMLEKYAEVENNRDKDVMTDDFDQCDNTIIGMNPELFGCVDDENINIDIDEFENDEPYIKPQGSEDTLTAEGSLESMSAGAEMTLGEPEPAMTLGEPEPAEMTLGEPEPAAEPEQPQPKADMIDASKENQTLHLDNIIFMLNSDRLTRSSVKILEEMASQLKKLGKYKLEIVGHTDNTGKNKLNQKLSAKRAKAVFNKLVSLGVPASAMKYYGKGESEPLYSNQTREGRQKNRRIEFKLHQLDMKRSGNQIIIDRNAKHQSISFDNIKFELNSGRLTRDSVKIVESFAKELEVLGTFELEIIGHTDNSGKMAFNRKLSLERAKSVYNKLVELGIEPVKMKATGKGESEPLYSNKTREGRRKNRRIEFKLHQINLKE